MTTRAFLSAAQDLAPALLTVGKEVSGAAAPPLKPLFATLEIIYARCMGMQQNKKQCVMLYEFCSTIVTAINTNVENGLSLDDKTQSIQTMQKLLSTVADQVLTISAYGRFDSFMKHDTIKEKIYELRLKLTDCFTVFGITSSLKLQQFTDDFTVAAEEDRQIALQLLAALEKAEQRGQRMELQADRIEQKLDNVLGMANESVADAVRITQLQSRMEPAGSAAESNRLATLLALQRQSGSRQLPLGDLVNEAQRVGTTAISHSATSELWKGIWLGDQTILLALKCPRISVPLSPNAVLRFQRSIDILRRIHHRNIMPLLGVKYKPDQSIEFVAFPWIDNGNILDYLAQNPNADRVKLMFGIACGLAHLHAQSPPIVHRSVQPCNILVDAEGEAIISDFGIAKALDDVNHNAHNYTVSNGPQTALRWMAPELSDGQYDRPADAYAWAMTTLQVLSGVQPFGDTKQAGRVVINVHQGMRPRRENHPTPLLTDDMWSLLERCWQHEPSMRATMVDVVNAIMKMRPDLVVH
ncbi:kinase-like protein [Exidia glandulosa HHB12029]|uniref:Kinase-like protein n=1 Tax=Exidia glandulosa HHB12029 TaxID=1314781 RepID=A0A165HE38_EXIGL|nr:kinase-like protein [Exidia glandulosa HHB12029]